MKHLSEGENAEKISDDCRAFAGVTLTSHTQRMKAVLVRQTLFELQNPIKYRLCRSCVTLNVCLITQCFSSTCVLPAFFRTLLYQMTVFQDHKVILRAVVAGCRTDFIPF